MKIVNIHKAKTKLSQLIEEAVASGDPFIISKAGKPLVKVSALGAPKPAQIKRLGFMAGQMTVPDDFGTMGSDEIATLFEGST